MKIYQHKDLYVNISSSYINNSPKLETTQFGYIQSWMNSMNYGIWTVPLINKKEWTPGNA